MANEFVARKGIISLGQISGSENLFISQNGTIGGNLTVGGTLTAQEFKAELISSSIIYESGSTKFGDSLDDTHQRTGSFFISGSAFNLTSSLSLLGSYTQNGTATITGQLNVDQVRLDGSTVTTNDASNLTLSTNVGTNSGTIVINQGANTNIEIAPNGTGDVLLTADTVRIGDSNVDATLTTNGTGDLILSTNSGTNSGTLRIADGVNGNITIDPNGSGTLELSANTNVTGTLNASVALTSSLLTVDNISVDANTISSLSGDIVLNSAGKIQALDDVEIASSKLSLGTTSTANRFTFDGGNFGSPIYQSGFAGSGFILQSGSNLPVGGSASGSGWRLELDHLSVRGSMQIYELLVNQIRATNGALWVSSVGKVEAVTGGPTTFFISFVTGSASGSIADFGHGFFPDDLIRAQRSRAGGPINASTGSRFEVYTSDLRVISASGAVITASLRPGSIAPSASFEYVRIGNTGSLYTNRRGAIYLTSDDVAAPFIDVIDNVTSFESFEGADKSKVRMGKLNGITSAVFGPLTGSGGSDLYGFWASGSAYLEGSINATAGKIADLTITNSKIFTGTGSYSNTNTPFFLSSSGQLSLKDKFIWDGNNLFISGAITASAGNIANFFIDTNNLWAGSTGVADNNTRIILNSSEPKIALGVSASAITVANTHAGVVLSGSGEFKAYRNENNYVRLLSTGLVLRSDNIALTGSNIEITANGTSSKIRLGNLTSANDTATTTSGSYIDNFGNALFQRNANNYAQISGSQVVIRSENIALTGSNIEISANGTNSKIRLGNLTSANDTAATTSGSYIDNLGNALFQRNANNFIQISGSEVALRSENFVLSGSTFRLNSAAGGTFALGTTLPTSHTSGNGIFLSGSGQALIGSASGHRIQFDGSNLILSSSTFLLGNANNFISGSGGNIRISGSNVTVQTPSFFLGGATQFISGSGGNIEISSSNFHLLNGNITASNATLSGTITATAGQIGGWTVGADQLFASSSAGGLFLSASERSIVMRSGSKESLLIGESVNFTGTLDEIALTTVVSASISASATPRSYLYLTDPSDRNSDVTASYTEVFKSQTLLGTIEPLRANIPVVLSGSFSLTNNSNVVQSSITLEENVISVPPATSYSLILKQGSTTIGSNLVTIDEGADISSSIQVSGVPTSTATIQVYATIDAAINGPANVNYLLKFESAIAKQYRPVTFINSDGVFSKISPTTTISLLNVGSGTVISTGGGGGGGVSSITAGDGLTGGTITSAGTLTLETGSNHFISGARKTISVSDTTGASGINLEYNQGTGQLSGSLVNSSITIGSTAINLGSTSTTIAGLTSLFSTNITGSVISASGAVTGGSLSIAGNSTLTNVFATNITASAVSASGTITGNAFAGGSFSGTTVTTTGNAKLGNATADAHTVTGSFGISGSLSLVGSTTLGNLFATNITGSTVSASGALTGGSLSITGNTTLANVFTTNITASAISASGTITGNAFAGGSFSGTTVTTTGNAKLGDATSDAHTVTGSFGISGSLSVVGNSTLGNVFATSITGSTISASGALTGGTLSVTGNSTLTNVFATNITASAVSASGTITGNAFVGGSFSGTTITTSGNAKLGDATSDAHTATGSLGISGSLSVVGTTTLDVLTTTGNTTLGNATSDLINITGSVGVSGSFSILQSSYGAQVSSSIAHGTSNVVVASLGTGSFYGTYFDYTIGSTSARRIGTVMTTWVGSNIEYTDFSTLDIGNTNGVSLATSLSGSNVRLLATNNSGVAVEIRTITRAI